MKKPRKTLPNKQKTAYNNNNFVGVFLVRFERIHNLIKTIFLFVCNLCDIVCIQFVVVVVSVCFAICLLIFMHVFGVVACYLLFCQFYFICYGSALAFRGKKFTKEKRFEFETKTKRIWEDDGERTTNKKIKCCYEWSGQCVVCTMKKSNKNKINEQFVSTNSHFLLVSLLWWFSLFYLEAKVSGDFLCCWFTFLFQCKNGFLAMISFRCFLVFLLYNFMFLFFIFVKVFSASSFVFCSFFSIQVVTLAYERHSADKYS